MEYLGCAALVIILFWWYFVVWDKLPIFSKISTVNLYNTYYTQVTKHVYKLRDQIVEYLIKNNITYCEVEENLEAHKKY